MKRKIALLMALVFMFVCTVPAAFAEELADETVIDVIEEAPAVEEELSEAVTEDEEEELSEAEEPAEEAAEEATEETVEEVVEEVVEELPEIENEEVVEEEIILEETAEDEMELNADISELEAIAAAITTEMLTSDREPAYAVTKNLDMSLNGDIALPDGVSVTFASSDESVIAEDGTVIRAIGEDKSVTVTATVTDGSAEATKELDFTVLNMETALLYANNYYYPDLKDTEFIVYGNSAISDFAYENANSGQVSTYLYGYEDGYGVNVKRLTGGGVCYLDSFTNVNAPEQKKMTFRTTLNINDWGSSVKRLDIEIFGKTTKDVSMGKVEINNATGAIYVQPTAGSEYTSTYISRRLNLNQDYKIEFVVDYENHKFEFLIDGVNYFADKEFKFLSSFKPAISKTNYYFFRQATGATFTLKDTVVTGEFDLSNPQVALDMIDESCFTYTNAGKITENFTFNVPANALTLADLYDMDITLTSSKPSSISIDGYNATVTKGEEKQEVVLTVEIATAEKTVSKSYNVVVHNIAATNMIEVNSKTVETSGDNKVVSVEVYCDNLPEGTTEAPVYLFAVRKEKETGRILEVAVDNTVLTMGATENLSATLADAGDDYDYEAFVWDSLASKTCVENQPPAEPTELVVTGTTAGTADLDWAKADDDRKAVSSYNIYRDGNIIDSTSATSYTGDKLDFGETYTFGVTTVDDSGLESEYMAEVVATAKDVPTITYESSSADAPNATQTNSDYIACAWQGQNTYLWTRPTTADGVKCHETTNYNRVNADDTITKIHSFFHTKTPYSYIDDSVKNIVIEITYFDDKPAENKGTETVTVSYQGGSKSFSFTDSGYWKTKTLVIDNAKFTEAALVNASSKYNIRFNSTTVGLKVRKTTVVKTVDFVNPTASAKMVDGALFLRDMLAYRDDELVEYATAGDEACLFVDSGKYFELNTEVLASNKSDVCVEVVYFDEGNEALILDYASLSGISTKTIQRENSGTWKTALFRLDDASFNGSIPGSVTSSRPIDFRISGDGGVYVKSVRAY